VSIGLGREGKEDDERSIMLYISLVIIHFVISSICTSTFTFHERQEQGRIGNAAHC